MILHKNNTQRRNFYVFGSEWGSWLLFFTYGGAAERKGTFVVWGKQSRSLGTWSAPLVLGTFCHFKPAALAFSCSATSSAVREGRARKAAVRSERAGHGKQLCCRGVHEGAMALAVHCLSCCPTRPVNISWSSGAYEGSSALGCFSLFTCMGKMGLALGCGQHHILQEWSNWFAIPMEKKRKRKWNILL